MWINAKAPSNEILDESPEQVALRKSLGFTHCVINDSRQPMAWSRSYEAACNLMRDMRRNPAYEPKAIVVI
jgi:heat shock protein HspQ